LRNKTYSLQNILTVGPKIKTIMRVGHFMAIILFCLTIVFGFIFYWDLQDGESSKLALFAPICTSYLFVVALFIPSSKLSENTKTDLLETLTPQKTKILFLGFVSMLYFNFWAEAYFTGEDFFTVGNQIKLLLSFGVLFFIIRRQFLKHYQ
jgi:hypothetical protein